MAPEDCGDELQEGDDVKGADLGARGLTVEEEVEKLEADGVALDVKPLGTSLLALQIILNNWVQYGKLCIRPYLFSRS